MSNHLAHTQTHITTIKQMKKLKIIKHALIKQTLLFRIYNLSNMVCGMCVGCLRSITNWENKQRV